MSDKYEITTQFKIYSGTKVYRIRALKDFDEVKKGDLGGYVGDYHNLSQVGNCWLAQYSVCYERGQVLRNAWALDYTVVKGSAMLTDSACIFDNVVLQGESIVKDRVQLYGRVYIGGTLMLGGDLRIGSVKELTAYLKAGKQK